MQSTSSQKTVEITHLHKKDGTAVNFTKDGTNVIKINANGSSDILDSSLFVAGEYYLEETKAPDGYMMSEPKSFTISASDAGKTLQIEVYDDKLAVLPVTGGEGKDRYISMTQTVRKPRPDAVVRG